MCVYYNDKYHNVNSNSMSFYNYNSIDTENESKVLIEIKYSIVNFFSKFKLE